MGILKVFMNLVLVILFEVNCKFFINFVISIIYLINLIYKFNFVFYVFLKKKNFRILSLRDLN